MAAIIEQLTVGPMMNFAYLVGDSKTKTCAAVDPGWDADTLFKSATENGWKIVKVLLTHTHFDHAQELKALFKLTGATVIVHKAEAKAIPKDILVETIEDGSVINIGDLKIKCIHTPGHTPGSVCFLVDEKLLTGDTLFVDGCGRVDLPGSNPDEMFKSLKRLAKLNAGVVIYPGHDYGPTPTSTIGEQKTQNPYMSENNEAIFGNVD